MYITIPGPTGPVRCSKCNSTNAVNPLNEASVYVRCLDCGHEKRGAERDATYEKLMTSASATFDTAKKHQDNTF